MMIHKIYRYVIGGIVWCGMTAALTACNDIVDYHDGYVPADQIANTGAPTITAVYDIADTAYSTPITTGELGQMVMVVGKNLNQATAIKFNTVECDMKEVYTMATQAVVRIPSTLSMEHVNQIEYTTPQGSTTYGFTIPFPDLTVDGLMCEFVNGGQPVTVTGKNFDLYDFGNVSKAYIGTTELTISDVTNTSMKIMIPDATPDNSIITLHWQDANGSELTTTLPYRPTAHLLFGDFSNVQMNIDGVVNVTKENDSDVTTGAAWLGYTHLHFSGSYGAWAWNTIDLSCNMVNTDGDLSDLSQYVLKFEVLNSNNFPLTENTGLQFCFNWGNSYSWNPGDGQGINTFGQWQTVTLPLEPMATNGISAPGSWQTLRIIFQPHTDYDADFRMANFRIEKK